MSRSRIPFLAVFVVLAFAARPAFAQLTITSLNPSVVTAGGPAFTLTVIGANFTTTSLVQVNGSVRATSFVSALPDEFFDVPTLWIHGHTHTSADYAKGRCRVLCNPRGYRHSDGSFENGAFMHSLVVDLQKEPSPAADRAEGRL